jgi:hypothetical protein
VLSRLEARIDFKTSASIGQQRRNQKTYPGPLWHRNWRSKYSYLNLLQTAWTIQWSVFGHYLASCGGVTMSPVGTSATIWQIGVEWDWVHLVHRPLFGKLGWGETECTWYIGHYLANWGEVRLSTLGTSATIWQTGVEWDWVHLVHRPLFGKLRWGETERIWYVGHYLTNFTSPKWQMLMNVEKSVEWLAGETEVPVENLSQCSFVLHKSYSTWPGLEPGPPR